MAKGWWNRQGLEFFDGLSEIFMIILCVAALTSRHRSIRTRWQAPKRRFWLRMAKKIALTCRFLRRCEMANRH